MARHHTFLILGVVLMVMALIFTLTGTCLVRFGGIIYRAEDPKAFWKNIVVILLLALACLGLYLYTAS